MMTEMNFDETKKTATGLSFVLADTYALYLKTQNFHWNVTGPRFHQLHGLFEEHYKEMAEAIDTIAERIKALGHHAPGSFKEFSDLTSIKEVSGKHDPDEMIQSLVTGHETISHKLREVSQIATDQRDDATADLITSRIYQHDKAAWMLRSLLQ